jgi:hypothetical protein
MRAADCLSGSAREPSPKPPPTSPGAVLLALARRALQTVQFTSLCDVKHEAQAADGLLVAERPLVSFLYRLMREGDVAPARLEQLLDELEETPPAVAVRYDLAHIARYAADAADRLEQLRRPVR